MAISNSSKVGEIFGRQFAQRRRDQRVLDGDGLFRRLAPRRRQIDRVLAPVRGGRAALDEAGGLEPVQQARNVAFGHIEALGELLLTDSFRLGQRRQRRRIGEPKARFPAAARRPRVAAGSPGVESGTKRGPRGPRLSCLSIVRPLPRRFGRSAAPPYRRANAPAISQGSACLAARRAPCYRRGKMGISPASMFEALGKSGGKRC